MDVFEQVKELKSHLRALQKMRDNFAPSVGLVFGSDVGDIKLKHHGLAVLEYMVEDLVQQLRRLKADLQKCVESIDDV